MERIPVLAFAGYSGSGKTTLIESLLPLISSAGLRVAVVKHDAHGEAGAADTPGSDSERLRAAGAALSVVSGPRRTAVFSDAELTAEQVISMLCGVDLILVEGYKHSNFHQIGLCRRETGKGFTAELSRFDAVVTDESGLHCECPVFHPDETEEIAAFILGNLDRFRGDP